MQVEALCRDGSRILVELSVGELEWHGGPRFHAFIRDVTDREAARSALELSEKRSRTAFENAPVADTPVIDFAMFLNRRCAPFVKTISSRFSAV